MSYVLNNENDRRCDYPFIEPISDNARKRRGFCFWFSIRRIRCLSKSIALRSVSRDVLSSSRTSLFPGSIQGEEEYDELRGGGDRRLVFRDRSGHWVGEDCCMGGANPVIFVVDITLVVVLEDVSMSSLFT
jgi:hypothetical protein